MAKSGAVFAAFVSAFATAQSTFTTIPMTVPWSISGDGTVVTGLRYLFPATPSIRWTRESGAVTLPDLSIWVDSGARGLSDDGLVTVGHSLAEDGSIRAVFWIGDQGPYVVPLPPGSMSQIAIAERASSDGSKIFGTVEVSDCTPGSCRAWKWDATSGTQLIQPTETFRVVFVHKCDPLGREIVVEGDACDGSTGIAALRSGVLDVETAAFAAFPVPAGFRVFVGRNASRDLSAVIGWAMVSGEQDRRPYMLVRPNSFRPLYPASSGGGLLLPVISAVGSNGAWAAGAGVQPVTTYPYEAVYWTPQRGMFRLAEYLRRTGADIPPDVHLYEVRDASADGRVLTGTSNDGAWIATLQPVSDCRFDLDFDGIVDDADFVRFIIAFNTPSDAAADANQDGVTDEQDFQFFAAAYDALICP